MEEEDDVDDIGAPAGTPRLEDLNPETLEKIGSLLEVGPAMLLSKMLSGFGNTMMQKTAAKVGASVQGAKVGDRCECEGVTYFEKGHCRTCGKEP